MNEPALPDDYDNEDSYLPAVNDGDQRPSWSDKHPVFAHSARQAIPLPVAALLWGAAETIHIAPIPGPLGAAGASAAYFVGAVAVWTTWGKNHPENRAERRRWARTIIAGGSTWLLWAASIGPGPVTSALLTIGGAAVALPHWVRNAQWRPLAPAYETPEITDTENDQESLEIEDYIDGEAVDVPDVPAIDVAPQLTANQLHWDLVVAGEGAGTNLVGSRLVDPEITDTYETYTIQLISGKQTTASALYAHEIIASAYGCAASTIVITPHETLAENKAKIRFTRNNPLAKTFWLPEPAQALDLTGGNIRGICAYRGDGKPVYWDFYRAGWGAVGGAVFGDTGSGKSEFLQCLITLAAYSRLIYPVVGCPQEGRSFPMWMEHSDWPGAGPDAILWQARGLLAAHVARGKAGRLQRDQIHIPTEEDPLLVWWLDELHIMAEHPDKDEFYSILDKLAREGRKTGIVPIIADQNPSVPETFNNMGQIRRSLLAFQVMVLRIGGDVDGMLPGMHVTPNKLPSKFPDGSETAGLGAMIGEREPSRGARLRDSWKLAQEAPQLKLRPMLANAMGAAYLERNVRHLIADGEAALDIAVHDPEWVEQVLANNPELREGMRLAENKRREAAEAGQPTTTEPAFNTVPILVPAVPTCEVLVEEPPTWTCVEAVREVLNAGVTAFGEIQKRAVSPRGKQYGETTIRKAITELIAAGEAEDGGHGHTRRTNLTAA